MRDKIRQIALGLLARRDHTQQEILQKLRLKGYVTDEIKTVIETLAQTGLIDDARFTENYIHWRRGKGYGPLRLHSELRARGIADEVIAEHLQIADNAWSTEARSVWQKQFKSQLPIDFKSRAKQMRFLQYRGFTQQHINSIFKDTDIYGDGNDN